MNRKAIAGFVGISLMTGVLQSEAQQQLNMDELQKGLAGMMQAVTTGATNVTMVDFRELKALLPASLPKLKRTSAKGEKNGALGMTVSQATGQYENEDGGSLTLEIQDFGGTGMSGLLAMGFQTEVESESDDGYEKSYTYKDHRIQEEYSTSGQSGELKMLAGKRIVVNISVNGLDAEAMKTALDAIDLSKLDALASSTNRK